MGEDSISFSPSQHHHNRGNSISIVGLNGTDPSSLSPQISEILSSASTVVGSTDKLAALDWILAESAQRIEWRTPLEHTFQLLGSVKPPIVLLASGDPGYFGVTRLASKLLEPGSYEVHPAPSSISLAFARLGLNWDDAVVISMHGRQEEEFTAAIDTAIRDELISKVALLCSPSFDANFGLRYISSRSAEKWQFSAMTGLGTDFERIWTPELEGSTTSEAELVDPDLLNSAVLIAYRVASDTASSATVASRSHISRTIKIDAPSSVFGTTGLLHATGPYTKEETRAVIVSKLGLDQLESGAKIYDLGAGSGTVGIAALALRPDLNLTLIERNPERISEITENLHRFSLRAEVVCDSAENSLDGLGDAKAVFIGGGGPALLESVIKSVNADCRIVAATASLEHAIIAEKALGHLCQVAVSSARTIADGTIRLAAENPVFIAWRSL